MAKKKQMHLTKDRPLNKRDTKLLREFWGMKNTKVELAYKRGGKSFYHVFYTKDQFKMAEDIRPRCPQCGEPAITVRVKSGSVLCQLRSDGKPGDVLAYTPHPNEILEYQCGGPCKMFKKEEQYNG